MAVSILLRTVSPELQGAIVGGLIALVASLVGGGFTIYLQRRLRERGQIQAMMERADVSMHGKFRSEYNTSTQEVGKKFLVADESHFEQMHEFDISYNFRIALFNEKDVDTGLSNIHGAIIGPDGKDFAPLRGTVQGGQNTLNLPSRKWVAFNLTSENFSGDKLEPAKSTRTLQVRGKHPDGRDYKSPHLEYKANDYLGEDPHYSV